MVKHKRQFRLPWVLQLVLLLLLLLVAGATVWVLLDNIQRGSAGMLFQSAPKERLLFCFYSYLGEDGLLPESINGTLCSHIVYGFADILNDTVTPRGSDKDGSGNIWNRVTNTKLLYPHLSVLLSVGASAHVFSSTTATRKSLDKLITSAEEAISKHGFDGLDIDWEFPAWSGSPWNDRENFINLLSGLRQRFDNVTQRDKRLLLTASVAAPFTIVDTSYDVPAITRFVDYCFLMGYDFNRYDPLLPLAEFNSPLYKHRGQVSVLSRLNLASSAEHWLTKGMSRYKLIIGLPFYAVTFKLRDPARYDVGSPITGVGLGDGTLSYFEVCNLLEAGGWTYQFHNESRVPYAFKNYDWISYDDETSILEKMQWILDNKFAGVMVYNLNQDDFARNCSLSQGDFPLLRVVHNCVQDSLFRNAES